VDGLVAELLACPDCRLALVAQEGALRCSGCGAAYPEKDGVVLLLPRGGRTEDPWQETATQLDGYLGSHPETARRLLDGPPDTGMTVDFACGTGTLIEDLLAGTHGRIIGTDISPRVLRRLCRRCPPAHGSRLDLLAVDARRMAFRHGSLDRLTTFESL